MDIATSFSYAHQHDRFYLLNPIRCKLDDDLQEFSRTYSSLTADEREQIRNSVPSDSRSTLFKFSLRSAVFALRSREPRFLITAFTSLAMIDGNSLDPRDLLSAISHLFYVRNKLDLANDDRVLNAISMCDSQMQDFIHDIFNRKYTNPVEHSFCFREVTTKYGIGLIHSDSSPFEPTRDLLNMAMEIALIIESDRMYCGCSIQIESNTPPSFSPNRGGISMRANPDSNADVDMNCQMFHIRLVEMTDEEKLKKQIPQLLNKYHNEKEAYLELFHGPLRCSCWARSYVMDIDSIETDESLRRFEIPFLKVLKSG